MLRNNFILGLLSGITVSVLILGITHLSKNPQIFSPEQGLTVANKLDNLQSRNVEEKKYSPIPVIEGLLQQHSENHQEDDTSVADFLYSKVRVLCWIMTSPDNVPKKAVHVYKTWAHRCNKLIFVSSQANSSFYAPIIKVETEEGREHLTAKTMHAFKYVHDNYLNDADWFMKADDDTFAIMENLRYFLADKNPNDPVFYGHHFQTIVKPQGYYSGGGGYVLSKEALKRYVEKGFHRNEICREDGGAEDAEFGRCMQNLGVRTAETYDERGASRFHCFNPGTHIHGGYPDWYLQYDSHGAKHGVDAVSDYPITFHYVSPEEMYSLAWYTYHLKLYGHRSANQPKLHEYYISPNTASTKADAQPKQNS